jgi:hypothetical protein
MLLHRQLPEACLCAAHVLLPRLLAYVSVRQHTSAYVSYLRATHVLLIRQIRCVRRLLYTHTHTHTHTYIHIHIYKIYIYVYICI